MATYDFRNVLVWDALPGGALRTLRNGVVTVKSAATNATVTTVTSNSNGMVTFTTTDVPTVYLVTASGFTSEHITAASAIEGAAAAAVNNDAGVASFVNTSGSATRTALDARYVLKGALYFDIRNYGATTSSTDNRAAIQSALDAAASSKGVVFVPVGTWNVKAIAGRTLSVPAGVTILGEDRKGSIIRVHESSGDWGNLLCYPAANGWDGVAVCNLTLDGSTNTSPTTTASTFTQSRTLINSIGANVTVRDCDLLTNGVWAIHHVGDNFRFLNNDVTADMTNYTLGWFDQSLVWFFSQGGRVVGNSFTVKEAATNTFVVQTAIEFQGHNNTVADNKTAASSRTRNAFITTASTYWQASSGFYPASPKGANNNVIEGNVMTAVRNGVEIWGMVVTGNLPIQGLRIRRNVFTIDTTTSVQTCSGVSTYVGTSGATGNDGPQTGSIVDLAITDNVFNFLSRRVSTSYFTADQGVRLVTEIPVTDVLISGNVFNNAGGFGVLCNVDAAYSVSINHVDIVEDNRFVDVREPVRIVRNVNYWRAEGNTFRQTQVYGTVNDNMIETVAHRPGDWSTEVGGIIRNNTVRTQATHKAYYPQRDHGISQAYAPAARGYVVEEMDPKIQPNASTPLTLGTGMPVRRYSDGALMKPSATVGATLGTLSGVTISSVIDNSNMTVNDASNIYPGQVLALPTLVFTSPTAFVLAVVGNTVKTAATNLTFQSGKTTTDAAGQALTFYGTLVAA